MRCDAHLRERRVSDILVAVRRRFFLTLFGLVAAASAVVAQQQSLPTQPPQQAASGPAQPAAPEPSSAQSVAQTPTPAQAPAQTPAQPPPSPPRRVLSMVVLDPAHGGTDPGARGSAGAAEKDVVLQLARAVRFELERQGLRVVMTREGDQNPSSDDRAAVANAPRDAVFLSFHVSSTGQFGTVRAYTFNFAAPPAAPAGAISAGTALPAPAGLREWDEAQKSCSDLSRRLADLLQVQLAQRFTGSPDISSSVPVRGLRSVAAPAVAIEVSNISVEDPKSLEAMASPLAAAVAHAVMAFRPVYEAEVK